LPLQHPALHGGQSASIEQAGKRLGVLGALHPALQRRLELNHPVFLFELDLDELQQRGLPVAKDLSRFPEVSRDLAFVVGNETPAAEILRLLRENAGEFLTDLRIFDVYQGDAVGKNKKSVALGLTWQHPSRTLSDDEINTIITNCVKALEQQFNANLRT
jgi:phenylalanyl-tRNA synthetase beta chain